MAVSAGRQMRDGGDIMLFYWDGSSYTSIAHGTSHQLSLSTQTEDINTKDAGKFGLTEVSRIQWSITADHLYTRDGWNTFYSYMTANTTVNPDANKVIVVFGEKDGTTPGTDDVNIKADGNWTPNSTTGSYSYVASDGTWATGSCAYAYVYSGKAVINSLNLNAQNGQKATVSVELQGQGALSRGIPTA